MSHAIAEADVRAVFDEVRALLAAGRAPGAVLHTVTRSEADLDVVSLSPRAAEEASALLQLDGVVVCAAGEAKQAVSLFDAALSCAADVERIASIWYHRGLALLLETLRGPPEIHREGSVSMPRSPVVRLFPSALPDVDPLLDLTALPAEPYNGASASKARRLAAESFEQSRVGAPNELAAVHGALCHLLLGVHGVDMAVRSRLSSLRRASRTTDARIRDLAERCVRELETQSWWSRRFGRVGLPPQCAVELRGLELRLHEPPSLAASQRCMIVALTPG